MTAIAGAAEAAAGVTEAVHVHRLVYARPMGFRPLELDLYVPEHPKALCVYFHGGGWRQGGRADPPRNTVDWTPSFFEQVAARGLAIASVDYRHSAEATFPAQLDDARAALDYLLAHAAELHLAATVTVAWGVSAGGHLAALLALTGDSVEAVVCWYPPTDLRALADDIDAAGATGDRGPSSREALLLGAPVHTVDELAAAASPVTAVTSSAPPFLFVHGTADVNVPPRQSSRLIEALESVGVVGILDLVEGGTHMLPEISQAQSRRIVDLSVDYLLGMSEHRKHA